MPLDNLLLLQSSSFLALYVIWVSVFSCRIFVIFESSRLSEFLTDLQDSGLQSYSKIFGTVLLFHEPVHLIVIFQYLKYFETPCSDRSYCMV